MSPWVNGVAAITLFQNDLPAARTFYEQMFGLPVLYEESNSVVFRFDDTLINLLDVRAADELVAPGAVGTSGGGYRALLTFEVEDVDALCEQLSAKGSEVPL